MRNFPLLQIQKFLYIAWTCFRNARLSCSMSFLMVRDKSVVVAAKTSRNTLHIFEIQ